jgi:hypothetical protein
MMSHNKMIPMTDAEFSQIDSLISDNAAFLRDLDQMATGHATGLHIMTYWNIRPVQLKLALRRVGLSHLCKYL